ncbi:hypothetical protein WR25_25517 isoform A [Diploscapter pachys]|uniref:Metalloendopeptidase n=1 Tax=Diploscapter pachys TaxID=2018661 RepID=A0A2A2JFJ7_9BILA|nr:hypothetical protein WR25_25517 isoform A [Diploscapter pachys]
MRTLTLIALTALLAVVVARAGPGRDKAERKPGAAAGRKRVDPDAMTDAEGEEFEKVRDMNLTDEQFEDYEKETEESGGAREKRQDVSIGNGCEVIGTVVHEIMHALGVFHFQSRYDRDSYVSIEMTYVTADRQNNFVKYTSTQTVNYTPYEYGSTMHYSANSFVSQSGAISIWPSDQDYVFTMGNRIVSFYDIKLVNSHYACTCASGATCVNGGERNPKNCAQCLCPMGYGGTTCSTRPAGCGSALTATTAWQTTLIQAGVDSQTLRNDFTLCTSWVSAPAGKTLQFNITGNFTTQCQYGCPFNGLEIKNKADLKAASPRHCCSNTFNKVISSTNNPTPLIAYNRYYITQFQVTYRYV